ncbi:MAG: N-glycosylase/DNA lyase [Elusimicrobiota bacterium]|jgi:N-glycosylase/DNA lyase|nr:N-glycosylase/DNA lyase [Elusimicrobiota bacterium]
MIKKDNPIILNENKNNLGINYYKNLYNKIQNEIINRFNDFEKIKQKASEDELFTELCFCLCTPQTKAINADKAIKKLIENNAILTGNNDEIAKYLKGLVRFHDNKAKYIIEARNKFRDKNTNKIYIKKYIFDANKNNKDIREFFYENVKGLGLKEASHFVRNIGLGENIAILDRHILKNLKLLKVIQEIPKTLTKKTYFDIEKKLENFSKKINIKMHHLDFVFWYNETEKIFK